MIKSIQIGKFVFWALLIAASAYFYYDNAIAYLFGYRNERFGETLFNNQLWFVSHIIGATCSLFLGPIQFWKFIRTKYIRYHRLAGKIYIIGSLVAGVSAFRLSLIYDCIGCRYSLIILSFLFLLTTALAWYAILQRNIIAHQQFMVRSYTCALAFVFVRLYQIVPLDFVFAAIEDRSTRQVLHEAIYSFAPLLIVEIVMIWIPSIRKFNLSPK